MSMMERNHMGIPIVRVDITALQFTHLSDEARQEAVLMRARKKIGIELGYLPEVFLTQLIVELPHTADDLKDIWPITASAPRLHGCPLLIQHGEEIQTNGERARA